MTAVLRAGRVLAVNRVGTPTADGVTPVWCAIFTNTTRLQRTLWVPSDRVDAFRGSVRFLWRLEGGEGRVVAVGHDDCELVLTAAT